MLADFREIRDAIESLREQQPRNAETLAAIAADPATPARDRVVAERLLREMARQQPLNTRTSIRG